MFAQKSLGGFLFSATGEEMRTRIPVSPMFAVLTTAILAFWAGPAFAAIPLITDDTGTQGKGKFQVEILGEYGHDKEESVTNENADLAVTLTYGISAPVDLILSVPYQSWRTGDSDSEIRGNGLCDPAIETKWRFYESGGLSFALKPGFTIPLGDEEKDLGNGKLDYYLFFIASSESGPLALHVNLAYIRNNNMENERRAILHASLAPTVDIGKNVKLVGDIGVETNPDRSSSDPPAYVLGGVIYSPGESFDIGVGLKGGLTGPEPDLAVRGGVTWRF